MDKDEPNPFDEEEQGDSQSGNAPIFLSDTQEQGTPWVDHPSISPVTEKKGRRFNPLMGIVGVAVLGFCLVIRVFFSFNSNQLSLVDKYFPSPTATPTRTPTITPSPTRTSTPTPNLTATQRVLNVTNTAQAFQSKATSVASEWKIVLEDNFDSNKSGWGTGSSDTEWAKSLITVADGKYSWDIATHKLEITWERAHTKSLDDFAMSVYARQIGGPSTAEYGLTFREDSSYHGYYFGITNKGEYFLYLYNDEWITLIDYTQSDLILPNEYNRLTVIAEGSHFTFFINNQYLAEHTDESIKNGNLGLFSLLYKPNQQATFEFDNFELRAP